MKKEIIKHIKEGKPFQYSNYYSMKPSYVMFAKPFEQRSENDKDVYHITTRHISQLGKLGSDFLSDSASMDINGGKLSIIMSVGDIFHRKTLEISKIILLDNEYKPLNP